MVLWTKNGQEKENWHQEKIRRNLYMKVMYGISTQSDGIEITPNVMHRVNTVGNESTPNEEHNIETAPNEVYGINTNI